MQKQLISNFEALTGDDLNKFSGKWIAVINGKIVMSKSTFKEVHSSIKQEYPEEKALFGKVPEAIPSILSID